MKICSKCHKSWQDDFNLCPICGGELLPEQPKNLDSIYMGDGNAINGGIHVSKDFSSKDDHSVSSSHNISNSNNNTTNYSSKHIYHGNYTHVEREKSKEEILIERKSKFREYCKEALNDGLLTREERNWLNEQRSILGLSAEMADHILNDVISNNQHSVMSMGTVQRIQFNNFKRAIEGNMVDNIKKYMPQIKVIANKFQEEELQFLYHLALAALNPEECVEVYKNREEDKYWLTFWVYVALYKLGDVPNAENALIDLGRWQGLMPDENLVILGAFGALINNDKNTATELFNYVLTGECSHLLNNMAEVISAIINYHPDDADVKATLAKHRFYVKHFLENAYESEARILKQKEEEEKRIKEEARRKAEEEAKRKQEEEERRRKEREEQRQKEEAERLRKEREELARKKAAEEARKKAEAELRLKIEEEKKRKEKEEEERRRKEREEQRKKEEAERVRKEREELARKRAAEEEMRRKIEEEKKRMQEEAERKAKEAEEEERRRRLDQYQQEAKRKAEEMRKAEEEAGRRPRFCNKCGTQIPFGASFCKSCGTKAPVLPTNSGGTASRVCPKCNNNAGLDAKFCKKCGYKF